MTSRDCRYAITDVNTSKETTCRPDRRQTLLQQMNLPFVPLIVAPFVPAVPGLVQMAPPPVPCTTPTQTPLSSAARRPACQAHIQRSGRIDTSAATACQTPMDMYKLYNSNKEVLVPMLALNQPLPPTSYSNSSSSTCLENHCMTPVGNSPRFLTTRSSLWHFTVPQIPFVA